jgi:hypothetical protein
MYEILITKNLHKDQRNMENLPIDLKILFIGVSPSYSLIIHDIVRFIESKNKNILNTFVSRDVIPLPKLKSYEVYESYLQILGDRDKFKSVNLIIDLGEQLLLPEFLLLSMLQSAHYIKISIEDKTKYVEKTRNYMNDTKLIAQACSNETSVVQKYDLDVLDVSADNFLAKVMSITNDEKTGDEDKRSLGNIIEALKKNVVVPDVDVGAVEKEVDNLNSLLKNVQLKKDDVEKTLESDKIKTQLDELCLKLKTTFGDQGTVTVSDNINNDDYISKIEEVLNQINISLSVSDKSGGAPVEEANEEVANATEKAEAEVKEANVATEETEVKEVNVATEETDVKEVNVATEETEVKEVNEEAKAKEANVVTEEPQDVNVALIKEVSEETKEDNAKKVEQYNVIKTEFETIKSQIVSQQTEIYFHSLNEKLNAANDFHAKMSILDASLSEVSNNNIKIQILEIQTKELVAQINAKKQMISHVTTGDSIVGVADYEFTNFENVNLAEFVASSKDKYSTSLKSFNVQLMYMRVLCFYLNFMIEQIKKISDNDSELQYNNYKKSALVSFQKNINIINWLSMFNANDEKSIQVGLNHPNPLIQALYKIMSINASIFTPMNLFTDPHFMKIYKYIIYAYDINKITGAIDADLDEILIVPSEVNNIP